MTTFDITEAARVTFRLTQDFTGEWFQFGIATGRRELDIADDLLDRCAEWGTDHLMGKIHACHLEELVYSEWGTSGFTGFHQKRSKLVHLAAASGAPLPPQCAVAVTLLNDTDTDISLKRRRGRLYLGLIAVTQLDTAGKLATIQQSGYLTMMQDLTDSLQSAVPASGNPDGPCIASAAEGRLITVDKYGVGLGIDTQRRRRQKIVESILYGPADT